MSSQQPPLELFVRWLRRLGEYHCASVGGIPQLWSDRRPGVQIEVELRKFWRGWLWVNRDEHRLGFGWGDRYAENPLSIWIRYWPISRAKAEEIPF